jgi:ribonuclease G
LELYEDEVPIFEAYGIEHEIDRSIEKKIWLKSGGYIIIEQTEALVVIDVNTGRYVGSSKNVEETMLNTNLEAAKEIAYQLKLRNLGGIIIVDFIDMEKKENKEKVVAALKDGLKKDRAKTNVLGISELGLVEMTRKRTRESLKKSITTVCPYCEGRGHIKSFATISNEIFRQIERYLNDKEVKTIMVYLNKDLHDYIYQHRKLFIQELENKHSKAIVFEAEKSFHEEQYEISFKN